MSTVFNLFAGAAGRFPDRVAVELQRRDGVEAVSYADLHRFALGTAGLLHGLGVGPGARCAILADNAPRWCGAYLGVLRLGAVAVPLDTAYQPYQIKAIVADCGASVLLTSAKYLPAARTAVAELAAPPRLVLLTGKADAAESLDGIVLPAADALPPSPATPSDPAVILYTSGTTSDPKGVVLTNENLIAERAAAFQIVTIDEHDVLLGVLPLFHALAQVANLLIPLTVGACIVFLETVNSTEMVRVLAERGITAFCVVPQFYYLIHQRVMDRVAASPLPARLLFRGMLAVNGASRRWLRLNAGRLLFGRVHAAVGPSMRILVTGGSRFDPRVGRDLFAMGFNIIQAYGLTECSGGATATRQGDPHIESVGQALPGVEVRILDEPAGDEPREYPDGEVLIKGPIVMAGYYNRPEATAETIRDGWLYTGDLGYLDREGRLHVTGRKKDVIVLASGKNIYPEEIEAVYLQSPFVKEVCVLGVAREDEPSAERLHAIVVPDFDLARERRVVNIREMIRFDIESLSLSLPHHKRVLSFDIWQDDLPRTTTRKLKRNAIERAYRTRAASPADRRAAPAWTDEDQAWAAEPHAQRVLEHVRAAVKSGALVGPGSNLELDLGFDSMERVELLSSLELQFGVHVPEETAQRVYTVRELADALRAAGAAAPAAGPAVVPWTRLLAEDPDDPDLRALLRPRPFYAPLAFAIVKIWHAGARMLIGLRVSGRGHMPAEGPFLISPNHQSYLDAFLLVGTLPYRAFRRLFFVGASEYFATPLLRRFARFINVVPVDPDANLVRAMQAGAFGLRHGRILVLFPEGERSPDGTVRAFKKGASILATHLKVPIVPVAIHGVFELWPRGGSIRWTRLLPFSRPRPHFRFGRPLSIERLGAPVAAAADAYARMTAALRDAVVGLWKALDRRARA